MSAELVLSLIPAVLGGAIVVGVALLGEYGLHNRR